MKSEQFVVCLNSADYPASLEPRKLYRVIRDPDAARQSLIRVIDNPAKTTSIQPPFFPRFLFQQICSDCSWRHRSLSDLKEIGCKRRGAVHGPSVVRQLEVLLFKAARARVTLARMSDAFAVQIKGLGLALCVAMYSLMAASRSGTLVNTPRRIRLSVMSRKNRPTISHDDLARGDADAHRERLSGQCPLYCLNNFQRRAQRPLGVFLVRFGPAEVSQNPITHIASDETFVAAQRCSLRVRR